MSKIKFIDSSKNVLLYLHSNLYTNMRNEKNLQRAEWSKNLSFFYFISNNLSSFNVRVFFISFCLGFLFELDRGRGITTGAATKVCRSLKSESG